MGFGDVKLFAAVGLLTGFPGTIYTVILSIVTAAVCFIIILVVSAIISGKSKNKDEDKQETDEKEQTTDETEENMNEEDSKGSYLAFGPYIMIASVIYIVFFDYIYDLVGMYFDLLR